MPIQRYNDKSVDFQSAVFQRRDEAQFAASKAIGAINMIPGIVGNWSMATLGATLVPDLSGFGMSLTQSGSPVPGNTGIAQHIIFDGTNDYLYRASEANIVPGRKLALGGWFNFNALGSTESLITKWYMTGAQNQFSLYKKDTNVIRFAISDDGSTESDYIDSTETIAINTWYYIAGYYTANTELALVVNKNWYSNVTSIPATIFAGTVDFTIGATLGASVSRYFNGNAMLCWLATRFADMPRAALNTIYEQTRAIFGI